LILSEKIEQVKAEFNAKNVRSRYTLIEEGGSNHKKFLYVGKRTSKETPVL